MLRERLMRGEANTADLERQMGNPHTPVQKSLDALQPATGWAAIPGNIERLFSIRGLRTRTAGAKSCFHDEPAAYAEVHGGTAERAGTLQPAASRSLWQASACGAANLAEAQLHAY